MQDARAGRKDIHPIGKKNPNLPFHPAVRAGDFIFVSGQVAKSRERSRKRRGERSRRFVEFSPKKGRRCPMSCASRPISGMPATSAVTTGCSENTSRMPCWHARPSRLARSSAPRSKWTPLPTSRAAVELPGGEPVFDPQSENRSAAQLLRRTRRDQIARPTDVGKRAEGHLLPGGSRVALCPRGLRSPVRQHADRGINPTAKVPTLIDGDLVIWESHTILRISPPCMGRR